MSEWEVFTADDGEPGIRTTTQPPCYPLSEYSDDWTPTGGLTVPTSDLPAPTSDELSWQTSDSLVQD